MLSGHTVKSAMVVATISAALLSCHAHHSTAKVLLPDGFVGWARLDYEVKGAPPLPREGERAVMKYPESGRLGTSSEYVGLMAPEVFYYVSNQVVPLPNNVKIQKWFSLQDSGRNVTWYIFVGTEQDARGASDEASPPLGSVVHERRTIVLPGVSGITVPDNKALHLTRRGGVPAPRAIVEARLAGERRCYPERLADHEGRR